MRIMAANAFGVVRRPLSSSLWSSSSRVVLMPHRLVRLVFLSGRLCWQLKTPARNIAGNLESSSQ